MLRRSVAPLIRTLMTPVAVAAVLVTAPPTLAHWPSVGLVAVEIVDRTEGTTLPIHPKNDQRFVVGTPGHEYAVRIRNDSGARVLAVTSVDGVNVVTGETASPDQSGYVIDAGDSVEIAGWRKSLERTAAFYFTDLGDSYAGRTGRPANVGVIGVAVFRERPQPVVSRWPRDRIALEDAERARKEMPAAPASAAEPPQGANSTSTGGSPGAQPQAWGDHTRAPEAAAKSGEANAAGQVADGASRSLASKLGTGFGRNEASYAQRVRFERASDSPAETVAIRYDRRENLVAMGVLHEPRYAERTPDPFPGMRFVPAPR